MDADWWKSNFDESRWYDFAHESLVPGASVEWEYPLLATVAGCFGDVLQFVPLVRVRRFVDAVEVIVGAQATQLDSQGRLEGQCVLAYADIEMLLGQLDWSIACKDGPAANRFAIRTKHGFCVDWQCEQNAPGTVSANINSHRRMIVERSQLNDAVSECRRFVREELA